MITTGHYFFRYRLSVLTNKTDMVYTLIWQRTTGGRYGHYKILCRHILETGPTTSAGHPEESTQQWKNMMKASAS